MIDKRKIRPELSKSKHVQCRHRSVQFLETIVYKRVGYFTFFLASITQTFKLVKATRSGWCKIWWSRGSLFLLLALPLLPPDTPLPPLPPGSGKESPTNTTVRTGVKGARRNISRSFKSFRIRCASTRAEPSGCFCRGDICVKIQRSKMKRKNDGEETNRGIKNDRSKWSKRRTFISEI